MSYEIKRVYDAPSADDGFRVLVDRLWPRGVSKAKARLDLWLKEVAPSADLRTWFGHDPERFDSFREKYEAELAGSAEVAQLHALEAEHGKVTLLYGAHDPEHNQAVVLRAYLLRHRPKSKRARPSAPRVSKPRRASR
jgi:DNA-3-methyladenine glycosylase